MHSFVYFKPDIYLTNVLFWTKVLRWVSGLGAIYIFLLLIGWLKTIMFILQLINDVTGFFELRNRTTSARSQILNGS